jgi:hypothetical protein
MNIKHSIKTIRPEDIIALVFILPSLYISSPYEYYKFLNGSIVVSKHLTAFVLLLIFAFFAALYENKVKRIIDTIRSGVKIPEVTIEDQLTHLWKSKNIVFRTFRDYFPFIFFILAYQTISEYLTAQDLVTKISANFINIISTLSIEFKFFITKFLKTYPSLKSILEFSHKTYFLSVPILTTYLYFLKKYNKFRIFFTTIMLASIFSLFINLFLQENLKLVVDTKTILTNTKISIPTLYTVVVLYYSFIMNKTIAGLYLPIALILLVQDIVAYSNNFLGLLLSIFITIIAISISKLIIKKYPLINKEGEII